MTVIVLNRPTNKSITDRLACGLKEVLSAWSLCIHTQPHDIHWISETEWVMPRRVGTASPSTARFPSHCGTLGCRRCGGTCVCQMFSLSFSNPKLFFLNTYFLVRSNKRFVRARKSVQATFFCTTRLTSTLNFRCENNREKNRVYSFEPSLTCPQEVFFSLPSSVWSHGAYLQSAQAVRGISVVLCSL